MKSKSVVFCALILIGMFAMWSCGSTKGYKGEKLTSSEVARVVQGNNKLKINKKNTTESALLIKVDSISVGSYMKGYPKQTDVTPGERTIEIRHFREWDNSAANTGAMFGMIGASIAESNNPHTHYKLTFEAVKGKVYTILPITDETTLLPEFYVIEEATNDTIPARVVEIRNKKKDK